MIKKLSKPSEFNHFNSLAEEWWDPYGKFKILHKIAPIRIEYIKNLILDKTPKLKNSKKPLNNLNILDLGCGGGLIAEPLARLGANITGVDFVKKNIEIAKNHSFQSKLKIKYLHQNLDNLKMNNRNKYDVILLLEVLEHYKNWQKIIINCNKFLKPMGKIIISTINRNILSKIFAIYFAENILKWVPKKTHSYNKLIKPQELSCFLNKKNFKIIDITGLNYNPILSEWSLNKKKIDINYFCTAMKFKI